MITVIVGGNWYYATIISMFPWQRSRHVSKRGFKKSYTEGIYNHSVESIKHAM